MNKFNQAIQEIVKAGGNPHLVGGAVRDQMLMIRSKDFDVEVFGLTVEQLIEALEQVGTPNIDDGKFGVIRLNCDLPEPIEFALPRKDNNGKRGFGDVFPNLSAKEAALRRDFTFNAISRNLITGTIIDPLGGIDDLEHRILRHCDDTFFVQDPLRAIRAFRFAGLLNASVAPETVPVLKSLIPQVKELSGSAMWSEWEKWASRSIKPSQGLKLLFNTGLIECFPEIEALVNCPQDSEWHPEGDVFTHTCHTVDAAAGKGVVVVLAALCHDFGKPTTTMKNDEGRWISPKHARNGEDPTRSFLARIGAPNKTIEQVVEIVKDHMVHVNLAKFNKRQARRLLVRLQNANVDDLIAVIEADNSGRPPLPGGLPEAVKGLAALCDEVKNEVKPFVLGRHLIAEGLQPGKHFGPILKRVFEAQLDGLFSGVDEGIEWMRKNELNSRTV